MLVAGRLLGGVIASLIALTPAVFLCVMLGIINPPPNHWFALIAIFVATAVCAAGLGSIVGTVLRGARIISMAASVVATYMFFLGGGFTTIAFLPPWLQTLSGFIPMRYAIDGMRQALFYSTLDGVAKDLLILSLTALVSILLGSYCVRRSWIN
jgi:ABC-type multidrug transport system permease subunit